MDECTTKEEFYGVRDIRPKMGGWAPGTYSGVCIVCKEIFIGDKRAQVCASCAYTARTIDDALNIVVTMRGMVYEADAKALPGTPPIGRGASEFIAKYDLLAKLMWGRAGSPSQSYGKIIDRLLSGL